MKTVRTERMAEVIVLNLIIAPVEMRDNVKEVRLAGLSPDNGWQEAMNRAQEAAVYLLGGSRIQKKRISVKAGREYMILRVKCRKMR